MAKGDLVAKRRFDDGSKKDPAGKSVDYMPGEKYLGKDAKLIKEHQKSGLLCSVEEFEVKSQVLDAKDKEILELQKQNEELKKALDAAEAKIAELSPQPE